MQLIEQGFKFVIRITSLARQSLSTKAPLPAAWEHCHVASWREGSLLLIVTDGHWATRLRYQQKRLLRQLQAFDEFASLTRILFKVQPPTVQAKVAGHTLDLSADAAQTIQATAEGITDPALRAALERLASHARPKPD